MPYKFEKLGLKIPKSFDKRIKLNENQKQEIRNLKNNMSQRQLAKKFNVSRRLIQFILFPEKLERHKELKKINKVHKNYYDKEKNRLYKKIHRDHKKSLYDSDKLLN